MTPEENEAIALEMIRFQEENPDYWGDQDENGVDLARLRENLKLTPAERIAKNGRALISLLQMEQARGRRAAYSKFDDSGSHLSGSRD